MYLGRHGGGWQVCEGNNKVVDSQYGKCRPTYTTRISFMASVRGTTQRQCRAGPSERRSWCTWRTFRSIARNKQLEFDAEERTFHQQRGRQLLLKREGRKHYRIPERCKDDGMRRLADKPPTDRSRCPGRIALSCYSSVIFPCSDNCLTDKPFWVKCAKNSLPAWAVKYLGIRRCCESESEALFRACWKRTTEMKQSFVYWWKKPVG